MGPVQIVLIMAAVIYVIGGRLVGQPLQAKRLIVVPAALTIYGLTQLPAVGVAAIGVLVVESIFGFALGAVRGVTIKVYEQGGHLWFRYTPLTIAVWVGTIGLRFAMVYAAHLMGVNLPTTASVLVSFGLSLFGEAAVVATKAHRSGVPYAPDRRRARA